MPATGLKIVGTGACLPWCSISSSFPNSLKTSGHWGYEFLEFWCWNLVPFLPDIGFQLLKSLWSSLTYFSFNDAPNVLYRWKIWTAGRPIQHPDSSTTKPCCCNSCSMWFCIVLLKYTRPIPYALMHPHTIRDAGFWTERWWHTGRWKWKKWSDMWPILGICALHLNPSKCTHTLVNTHKPWTHTRSSGQPYCCGARGAVGGSVPCSRVSPQLWYWGWKRALVIHSPHRQSLPDLRLKPTTYSWANLVMSMTESCQWEMQCRLRARRPRASSKGLRPRPLRTEISPVSLNILMMLCTVDDEICKAFAIWRRGTLFFKVFHNLFTHSYPRANYFETCSRHQIWNELI